MLHQTHPVCTNRGIRVATKVSSFLHCTIRTNRHQSRRILKGQHVAISVQVEGRLSLWIIGMVSCCWLSGQWAWCTLNSPTRAAFTQSNRKDSRVKVESILVLFSGLSMRNKYTLRGDAISCYVTLPLQDLYAFNYLDISPPRFIYDTINLQLLCLLLLL